MCVRQTIYLNVSLSANLIMTYSINKIIFHFLSLSCDNNKTGLSSSFLADKNNKMLRKNQYLLLPHVPNRSDKIDASNSSSSSGSSNNNETSDTSDMNLHQIVNHNFLMENSEHNNLAVINENDENYFEIFKTPMRFGTENNTEVTSQIGTTAHLPCTIHSVGEGVVSNYGSMNIFNFQFSSSSS